MKIKKGDTVLIISGKDRGKTGKVERTVLARKEEKVDKVVVSGINIIKKHVRPRREGQKGARVEIDAPFPVSRVMLICPECKKRIRVAFKILKNGKKQRICRRCKVILK